MYLRVISQLVFTPNQKPNKIQKDDFMDQMICICFLLDPCLNFSFLYKVKNSMICQIRGEKQYGFDQRSVILKAAYISLRLACNPGSQCTNLLFVYLSTCAHMNLFQIHMIYMCCIFLVSKGVLLRVRMNKIIQNKHNPYVQGWMQILVKHNDSREQW